MPDPIKVGISAFGKATNVFHAPLLQAHQGFKIKSIVERTKENSKDKYPEATITRKFEDMLEDPEIELVVITTPNQLHFSQAKKALEAGKHVVVDKPFTIDSADARNLIEIARVEQKILSVFHNRRWDSDHQTVKKLIKSGVLGKIVECESHYDRFRQELIPGAWREKNEPGAGILYDLGSHLIDQAVNFFGKPSHVYADIRVQREHAQADDNFEVILYYPGLKVTLKAGMLVAHTTPRFQILGLQGSYIKYGLDLQEAQLKEGIVPAEAVEPEEHWGKIKTNIQGLQFTGKIASVPSSYLGYYSNIYGAIREGKPLEVKPEEALLVIEIIEAAMRSQEEKRVVALG